MLDVKIRMEDLEDIVDIYADFEVELGYTVDTLEEAIEYMEDELSGKYKEKFIEIFKQQVNEINNFRENVIELHKLIIDVIDHVNHIVNVDNEQIYFEYDEEQFKKLVDRTEEQLDSNSYEYKRISQMSYGFERWYSSEQRKINIHIDNNQTLIPQTTSSIEKGLRIHDDKKVLHHNYKVMQKLDNALQDINFDDEIEKLQEVHKKLNKLELLNEYRTLAEVPTFDPISTSISNLDAIVSIISKKIKSSTPEWIEKLITDGKLNKEDIHVTVDGYLGIDVPITELFTAYYGADQFDYVSESMRERLSRWRLYGINTSDGYKYSLYKFDYDAGIAVSFVEITPEILNNVLNAKTDDELNASLHIVLTGSEKTPRLSIPFMPNLNGDSELAGYFSNIETTGSYKIIDDYLTYLLENYAEGNTVIVNGTTIEINDINNLSTEEINNILAATTGNSSIYSFAAENKYHADHFRMEAGVVTNAGKGEEKVSGITDGYLIEGSKEVNEQRKYHEK